MVKILLFAPSKNHGQSHGRSADPMRILGYIYIYHPWRTFSKEKNNLPILIEKQNPSNIVLNYLSLFGGYD